VTRRNAPLRCAPLYVCVALGALWASGCATVSPRSGAVSGEPHAVVEAYYDAVNRRDLLVLPAYVAPDVTWYSVIDGEWLLEVDSREALVEAFETYFARFPQTGAKIEAWLRVGDSIAVRERTSWSDGSQSGGGERLGVFETVEGRIVRVTYFLPEGSEP
jgi:hypothetical protein